VLLALLARGAAPPVRRAPVPTPPSASASVSVGYVLVPFVLTDMKGKPVKNLKEGDVRVFSDGVSIKTDLFLRSEDAPVSFTILLDGSGSMGLQGKIDGARAAIRTLLAQRTKGDDFALFVFAEGKVAEVVPFTEDAVAVRRAVDAITPFGRTAFYDALSQIPDKSRQGKNGSRAIILLTDGVDNASHLSRDEMSRLLEGIEVPVYPVGLLSPGSPVEPAPGQSAEKLLDLEILGHVARISGGRLALVSDPKLLEEAIRNIEKDLRTQYLVGFSPTGKGPVRYHHLTLKITGPARSVRVRAGYRGTDPPAR
jgi:Ca-activated chloride channel homolog